MQASGDGALAALKILDLTQFLSGPYCTQILGDLGAEVIKVEWPEGDLTRALPPHFVGEDSAYYLSVNRNKESIAVDLKTSAGRDLIKRLALACDVIVENFRPGVVERLGLDYDAISRERPSLIWCSISGFGQDGPYRDRPAYDMIVQAISGGMSLTGEIAGAAVRTGVPLGDLAAGMYGAIGILAALEERRRTGRGRFVDVSMLDCQIAMLSYQAAYHLTSGVVPGRQGRGHDSIPTYRSFTAADGIDVVITANTQRNWFDLCAALERPDLVADRRFASNEDRLKNRAVLWEALEAAFRTRPSSEWVARLLKAEIPHAIVNTLDRSLADPQVRHRDMVLDLESPTGLHARVVGDPIKFRGVPPHPNRYPPPLGADNRAVLSRILGLGEAEIDALHRDKVLWSKRRVSPRGAS